MKIEQLNEALYNKYIAPTEKPRSTSIGIEIEMPVVNLTGDAVDENIIIAAADAFREHFSFEVTGRDDNDCVNSMTEKQSGDHLSFDCSYSNLELSMGKGDDLNELHSRFIKYYSYLQDLLRPHGYSATELQDMLSKRDLPQFIDRKAFTAQLIRILDIAAEGLRARGKKEEHFLSPLYERAELLTNPAKAMVEGLENGKPMKEFIEKYAAV